MTDRNAGIGHRAARSLIEEITLLRDEIYRQSILLENIDAAMTAMYRELHSSSRPLHLRVED